MASLSAHLRQAGDHGRLGFHADCPVCREVRLFGPLSSEAVITRRARAALAAGVVAASLTTPPAVWGQELDTRQEGTAAPHEPGGGQGNGSVGELESPEFDPGGETDLPFEAEVPNGAPPDGAYDEEGETGPLELEPEVDHDVPPIDAEDTPAPGDDEATTPTPPEPPAPQPPVTGPSPPAADAPPADAREKPGARAPDVDREPPAKQRSPRTGTNAKSEVPHVTEPAPQPPQPVPPAPAEPPMGPPVQTAQTAPPTPATAEPAPVAQESTAPSTPRPGSRIHQVQPGESLWVIAKRSLPPGASMARIAREVNRLWELNEDRIATGDPDLLRIGTELRLR